MKNFMSKSFLGVLVVIFVLSLSTNAFSQSIVTDLDTGISVLLESSNGETIVTNLETGESIKVEGEHEGMTDEEYSHLMRCKRNEKAAMKAKMFIKQKMVDNSLVQVNSGSTNGDFSISGSWETPTYYINSTSISVTISQRLHPTTLTVTLFKEVSFWWDTSYGAKTFSPNSDTETWTGIEQYKYYYLKIEKAYNGYWTTGSYYLNW